MFCCLFVYIYIYIHATEMTCYFYMQTIQFIKNMMKLGNVHVVQLQRWQQTDRETESESERDKCIKSVGVYMFDNAFLLFVYFDTTRVADYFLVLFNTCKISITCMWKTELTTRNLYTQNIHHRERENTEFDTVHTF